MAEEPRKGPEISVVVPARESLLRLRWLLNALEEQTLEPGRFEVVVVHGPSDSEVERLLLDHPLGGVVTLRRVESPGRRRPARDLNLGWSEARAQLVAFAVEDCRPEAQWLERLLAAARRHPDAVVQGRTIPDPKESAARAASHWQSRSIDPPDPLAQACNVALPRGVLEATGGFDEQLPSGEAADLWMRVQAAGIGLKPAPDAVVRSAITDVGLSGALRARALSAQLVPLVKRHPALRPLLLGQGRHRWLTAALVAASLGRRNLLWAVLAVPYGTQAFSSLSSRYGRRRALLELPGRVAEDLVELGALATASARHRTLLL